MMYFYAAINSINSDLTALIQTDHITAGTQGSFSKTYDVLPKAIMVNTAVVSGYKGQGSVIIDNGTLYSACGVITYYNGTTVFNWTPTLSGKTISFPNHASALTGVLVTLIEFY